MYELAALFIICVGQGFLIHKLLGTLTTERGENREEIRALLQRSGVPISLNIPEPPKREKERPVRVVYDPEGFEQVELEAT